MPSPRVPSARVIDKRMARVVMNRSVLDALQLGMADSLIEIGERIIVQASAAAARDPETAARRGVPMMADTGRFVVYALGKKVGGDEGNTGKPRAMKTPKDQAVLGVWFGAPISHFAELGTVKEIARPFLLPAFNANIGGVASVVVPAMSRRARGAA